MALICFSCAMNAFLAVTVTRLPITSLEGITDKSMTMVLWQDDALEDFLKKTDVYSKAIKDDRVEHIGSTGAFIPCLSLFGWKITF